MNQPDLPVSIIKPHWSFWVISVVMLIWNFMGSINFLVQLDPEMVVAFRESERIIIENRPSWATLGFAASVLGGLLGCILLIMKKSLALAFFYTSLIGTITTVFHSLLLEIPFSTGELIGIVAMPVVISVFLISYSRFSLNKQWIK